VVGELASSTLDCDVCWSVESEKDTIARRRLFEGKMRVKISDRLLGEGVDCLSRCFLLAEGVSLTV
jgi:hypothetical protein